MTLEEKAPNSVGTMVDVGLDEVCYIFALVKDGTGFLFFTAIHGISFFWSIIHAFSSGFIILSIVFVGFYSLFCCSLVLRFFQYRYIVLIAHLKLFVTQYSRHS